MTDASTDTAAVIDGCPTRPARGRWVLAAALSLAIGAAAHAATPAPSAAARPLATTAEDVIARNVAARGGLDAWRRVERLVYLGHVERAASTEPPMRFVMTLKRPNLTRFEIKAPSGPFTRIFDGERGWKVRPQPDGREDLKEFSKEEVAFSAEEFAIDGPLIDAIAKGVTARFDGIDTLDDHRAYRLTLHLKSGAERTIWINTKTNLDERYDRPATNPLAPGARVSVFYRNYATVDGITLPMTIETAAAKGQPASSAADRLVLDRVLVNPPLPDEIFARPQMLVPRKPGASGGRGVTAVAVPDLPAKPRP